MQIYLQVSLLVLQFVLQLFFLVLPTKPAAKVFTFELTFLTLVATFLVKVFLVFVAVVILPPIKMFLIILLSPFRHQPVNEFLLHGGLFLQGL